MLDLHRLILLREVKLRGSMTAAARELSYSHSAVSQQLALLEREAGVTLLEKVGRGVKLTPAGEELVRNTEAILAAVERAESDLASANRRVEGTVNVAAFATISRSVMPAALAALAEQHPGLEVRLHLYDPDVAPVRLVSRDVDAVIADAYPGTEPVGGAGIHATVLGTEPMRAYLPAGFEGDARALARLPWIMEPRSSAATQWAVRVCREHGFEPDVAHLSTDVLFHVRMVEHGLAAAFLSDMVIREAGSDLKPSPLLPLDQHRRIEFLVREGAQTRPALAAIRDAVAARLTPAAHTPG